MWKKLEKSCKKLGFLADILYLRGMKTIPTYEEPWARIAVLEEQNRLKDDVIREKNNVIREKDNEILREKERIAYLERMLYGAKSDRLASKVPPEQPGLFDEFFKEAMDEKMAGIEETVKKIKKEAQDRRAAAKKSPVRPLKYRYEGLEERKTVLMPEGVDAGMYEIIGKDVTRILHREPAKMWVEVIERPILRHKEDKDVPNPRICQAEVPKAVIGGNHAGADVLAQIVIDKYRYHLPEYRQVKRFADLGVKLPPSTINGWVHAVASKLDPLYEAQRRDILAGDYLQVDEVPWRIADSPGKSRKGYAWQFLDARPESHGLYFLYMNGSRAGTIPRAELRDFHGAIQTDGYRVYDYFELQENVTLLGCMAHVRRKFIDAQVSHPQLSAQAVKLIEPLYELEANLESEGKTFEEIAAERREKAMPIMDAMEEWMKRVHTQCTPSDPMGKAIDYAYKLWPRLRRYADDGRYRIDNNPVERSQRPSVMGRKNYLFSKNDSGAVDNAIFYSLIESCDMVGLEPLQWLTDVLGNLHDDTPPDQIRQMLPYYYKASRK